MKKLLIILLLFTAFTTSAQVYQRDPSYGRSIDRYEVLKDFGIPTFCGTPTVNSTVTGKAKIAYDSCGHKFYVYDPSNGTWKQVSGSTAISNGLLSTGGISLSDSSVTIKDTIKWSYDGIIYEKTDPSTFVINSADSGYYRRDLIYADTSGLLYKIAGVQDTSIAVVPALPDNSVVVTIVDVYGNQIAPPFVDSIGVIPNLQQVTNQGNTTTNPIFINSNSIQTPLRITSDFNRSNYLYFKNNSNGSWANTGFLFKNDVADDPNNEHTGHFLQLYMGSTNSAFSTDGGLIRSNGTGGIKVALDSGKFVLGTGSPSTGNYTSRFEMGTDGNLSFLNYKNNANGDSVLSTDETGKVILKKVAVPDISGKVNYTDSLTKYVTPSQLNDSIQNLQETIYAKKPAYWDGDTLKIYTVTDTTLSDNSDTTLPTTKAVLAAINNHAGGSPITLQTNGTNNGSQTVLNLKQGTNITLADDGTGGVTINSSGGGGSTVVNDSLAQGFKISDSSVTGQTLKPYELDWDKLHTQRYFTLIDENFINYKSSWEAQQMLEDTAVGGTSPSISGGNLQITGSSIIKTNTGPIAAFCTVEALIKNISVTGTFNAVGPALVKDSTHYIAGVYDPVTAKAYIQINGSTVFTKNITLDSSYLKLYLIITGNGVNLWAKANSNTYYIGGYEDTCNLMIDSVLSTYKYGLFSTTSSSQSINTIAYLRGGASGGGGLLNVRTVVNDDGSPYTYGNKLLFTADLASPTGQLNTVAGHNYAQANACVFMMDINTFQVETVGRFYFHRSNGGSEVRTLGGTNLKLSWFPSKKKWLLIYDYFDWDTGNPIANDAYAWLDYEAVFGQTKIDASQLHKLGINSALYPNYFYDVSARYINGRWYALGSYTNAPLGTSWTSATVAMFSGNCLDTLNTFATDTTSTFLECSAFFKLGGKWYINAFSFQDTKGVVLGFPNLDSIGVLKLPYNVSSGVAAIPGYEVLPYQKNNKTEYYLFGFDSHNSIINGTEYYWSRGNLVVFKAKETSNGYEFPNKIGNQISFPVKDIVNISGRFPKPNEYFLNNISQTILGKKTIDSLVVSNIASTGSITMSSLTAPVITATTNFSTPNNTTNSTARFGALEFQSYAVNNNWFGDNTYFDGTNFVRRSAGYSGLLYFAGSEGQFRFGATSTAGSTVTQAIPFKASLDGTVAIGGTSISSVVGTYTGASLIANTSGVTMTNATATKVTAPSVIGGTGTTSTITYQSTSGAGSTGSDQIWKVGNNGATEAMRLLNSGNLGIGVSGPLTKLEISGSTTNSSLKVGGLELSSYAVNNVYIGNNIYYNGTNFVRRSSGYTGRFLLYNDEASLSFGGNSTAGSTVSETITFRSGSNGGVGLGNAITGTTGTYTGAEMYVGPTGVTINANGALPLADKFEITGNLSLTTAGNKIKIASGSNASIGSSTLVGGTGTVSTTAVTSSSKIYLTCASVGGTQGFLSVGTITAGTSFVINSSSATDTSTINWWIIN